MTKDKAKLILLALDLINQFGVDGVQLGIHAAPDQTLSIDLQVKQVALRSGTADAILVDDVHVDVGGLSVHDVVALMGAGKKIKAAAPQPVPVAVGGNGPAVPAAEAVGAAVAEAVSHPPAVAAVATVAKADKRTAKAASQMMAILEKADIQIRTFSVRVAREWMNAVLARAPTIAPVPVDNIVMTFDDQDPSHIVVQVTKGITATGGVLLGVRPGNKVSVTIQEARVGFIPVGWVANLAKSFINQKLRKLPGVSFDGTTVDVDIMNALTIVPLPVVPKFNLTRLQTQGRYLLIEGGEV